MKLSCFNFKVKSVVLVVSADILTIKHTIIDIFVLWSGFKIQQTAMKDFSYIRVLQ